MSISPGGRGAFGDWLQTEREKRYKTQDIARAAYRKLAGLNISASEYAQWESGSRVPLPTNPKRLALYAFYGSREEEPAPLKPPATLDDLVTALNAQTAAINRVMDYLLGATSNEKPAPGGTGNPGGGSPDPLPKLALRSAQSARGTLRRAAEAARRVEGRPFALPRGPIGRTAP